MVLRLAGDVGGASDRDQLLLADQSVEQLGVVDDLVLAAELRVLVLDGVEAVRAGDDDLGGADLVEGLDVLLGEHLEQELVAGPSRGVSGAGLAVTEDREGDTPAWSSSSATARVVFLARSS